jgi:hypothetical protein
VEETNPRTLVKWIKTLLREYSRYGDETVYEVLLDLVEGLLHMSNGPESEELEPISVQLYEIFTEIRRMLEAEIAEQERSTQTRDVSGFLTREQEQKILDLLPQV